MASAMVLVFVTIYLMYITHSNAQTCIYGNTPIQASFDIDKMVGTWYQYLWLPAPSQTGRKVWDDFTIILTKATDGHLDRATRARKKDGDRCCDEWVSKLIPQANAPGKFDYERNWNDTNLFQTDWLVTSADYQKYVIFYGCRQTAGDGTCPREDTDSYVFTRAKKPDEATNTTIAQEIEKLCLDISMYVTGEQNEDCKIAGEIDCDGTGGSSPLAVGFATLLLVVSIKALFF